MAKYKLTAYGCKDNETGGWIPNAGGNRHWRMYQEWLAEGNTPDPEFTPEELVKASKDFAITLVLEEYETAIAKPVTCYDTSGRTFVMDAKADSPVKMRDGIQFAEMTNTPCLTIVDYNNKVHPDILLEDARVIMLQQAAAYITNYTKKSIDRAAILAL